MATADQASVSIGELAELTGVAVATLRAWETRYGFPAPRRSAGGQRRYSRHEVDRVARVIRAREAGLSLEAAITRAGTAGEATASLFAALRRRHPELPVHVLSRRAMLAISTAIEDECCARGQQPVLLGLFERERFYRLREARWRDFDQTAQLSVVLADLPRNAAPAGGPVEIALPGPTPLRREWGVVCLAPDAAACLIGWERPGGRGEGRRFEALWSVVPEVVTYAAESVLAYARTLAPDLVPDIDVAAIAPPATDRGVVENTVMLLTRIVAELDSSPSIAG
ncbi:MAG TPA: MerR family transcriptional regulator [Mycobacteriales bacterium]|jgi:DNA-binding transcriptional MerR regulator|nr:MerR family transcriptional regulator [Mycobacteriales bacterium]